MYVNIQKAIGLTGKSRATISRHIKEGKLSKTDKGIDTAELIRVYGELKNQTESLMNHSITNSLSNRETWLMTQIEQLKQDLKQLKEESLEREKQGIEREKRLMALLEHQSSKGLFSKIFK